jgi:hypothetical protein
MTARSWACQPRLAHCLASGALPPKISVPATTGRPRSVVARRVAIAAGQLIVWTSTPEEQMSGAAQPTEADSNDD